MSGTSEPSILMVCSSGGHLAQLLSARSWWEELERQWVTFDTIDAKSQLIDEEVVWAHHPTTRNLINFLRNLVLAEKVIRTNRPDVVLSTGAAVALPFFLVAAAHRIPRVFVEVLDRIDSPTLTGRLCRPLSTLFCVQIPAQLEVYPRSRLIGPLL